MHIFCIMNEFQRTQGTQVYHTCDGRAGCSLVNKNVNGFNELASPWQWLLPIYKLVEHLTSLLRKVCHTYQISCTASGGFCWLAWTPEESSMGGEGAVTMSVQNPLGFKGAPGGSCFLGGNGLTPVLPEQQSRIAKCRGSEDGLLRFKSCF
jgi:hypothetical protein